MSCFDNGDSTHFDEFASYPTDQVKQPLSCHLSAVFPLERFKFSLPFSHLAGGYVRDTWGVAHTSQATVRVGIEYCRMSAGIGALRMATALGGECRVVLSPIPVALTE